MAAVRPPRSALEVPGPRRVEEEPHGNLALPHPSLFAQFEAEVEDLALVAFTPRARVDTQRKLGPSTGPHVAAAIRRRPIRAMRAEASSRSSMAARPAGVMR
jgi:hypothetical protein